MAPIWSLCATLARARQPGRTVPHTRCARTMLAQKVACTLCSASRSSLSLCRPVLRKAAPCRQIQTTSTGGQQSARAALPPDFQWYPDFFSLSEQRALLAAALRKLDATESRQARRRRKEYTLKAPNDSRESSVQSPFLPDELYDFQEVRLLSHSVKNVEVHSH